MNSARRILAPLIVPTVLIALAAVVVGRWAGVLVIIHESQKFWALLVVIPYLPYALLAACFILGWRYHSAALVCTALSLGLAYYGLVHVKSAVLSLVNGGRTGLVGTIMVLLPLNLGLQVRLTRRRIMSPPGIAALALILLQAALLVLLHHSRWAVAWHGGAPGAPLAVSALDMGLAGVRNLLTHDFFFEGQGLPTSSLLAFGAGSLFALLYYVRSGDVRIVGNLCALILAFMAFTALNPVPAMAIYFSVAALVLVATTIEASFSMAYLDELTGLPGRRSLNEALLNLGKKFAIAMLDVDHFKQFNDTYGHKVGDQVLRTIAARLLRMEGGAKVFRYGGEEFTAIFPGKGVREAAVHLERFRRALEATPFVIRRRSSARTRAANPQESYDTVHLTLSIGLAATDSLLRDPEKILKAADRMLGNAKQGGRNRCCVRLPKNPDGRTEILQTPDATEAPAAPSR